MDRSSLPATNDLHIHNGTRDHTAKCARAETSWIKVTIPTNFTLQLYHILQSMTPAIYPWMMLKPSQN